MHHRMLTVSSAYTHRTATGESKYAPVLRVQGKWLEEAGFEAGSKVKVYVLKEHSEIILKRV